MQYSSATSHNEFLSPLRRIKGINNEILDVLKANRSLGMSV